jgi:hypothetical protein
MIQIGRIGPAAEQLDLALPVSEVDRSDRQTSAACGAPIHTQAGQSSRAAD